jgi:glucose/arabinose dehydrogenase
MSTSKKGQARAIGCALVAIIAASSHAPAAVRFSTKTVARLDFATGMQFTPSGDRLFVNERGGRIRIIERGRLLKRPFATVDTTTGAESGLLGLALHPKFEDGHPWVYAFYTLGDGSADRVVRFRARGNVSVKREVILDNMPAGGYHHGGIVAFGPDGKLYISNGEAHNSQRAQDPSVLGGKIYRLNDDGSIPRDNPFAGEPTFAYGIRNPFGLAFDPETGRLWETENGPQDNDEVNLILRGKNYGWPVVRGKARDSRFVDPVVAYRNIIVPTMAAFGGDALPEEYRGNLFFGTFGTQNIHRLVLSANRSRVQKDEIFLRPGSGVVGMTMGPDGLYFTTPERVVRIAAPRVPAGSASPRPTATGTITPQGLASPAGGRNGSAAPAYVLSALIGAGLIATIALLVSRARRS